MATRNVREIAHQLGVAHILEGTVQRVGDRVKISAQLIDARTDTQLWATTFDRSLADVFAVQSEVALNIVNQLKAKLSSAEEAAIKQKPTNDLIAYDLFARAKVLIESTVYSSRVKDSLFEAAQLLDEATARDPTFLRAFCQLARVHDKIYSLDWIILRHAWPWATRRSREPWLLILMLVKFIWLRLIISTALISITIVARRELAIAIQSFA